MTLCAFHSLCMLTEPVNSVCWEKLQSPSGPLFHAMLEFLFTRKLCDIYSIFSSLRQGLISGDTRHSNTIITLSSHCKVSFRVLRHFTHKASVTSVNAEANVHSADWLMSVFVNELNPPHVRSQQGQCMR